MQATALRTNIANQDSGEIADTNTVHAAVNKLTATFAGQDATEAGALRLIAGFLDWNGAAWPAARPAAWGSRTGMFVTTSDANADWPPAWAINGDTWDGHPDDPRFAVA